MMFLEFSAIKNLFTAGNCQVKKNANKQSTWFTNTRAVAAKILWGKSMPLSRLFPQWWVHLPQWLLTQWLWLHASSDLHLSHLSKWLIITPGRKTLLFSCWNIDFFNKPLIWFFNFCRREQDTIFAVDTTYMGLPWWLSGKESICQCRRCRFRSLGP